MHFFLVIALFIPVFVSAADSLPFELYFYGEKPGQADPFPDPQGKPVRLHLARDGFASLAIRFPEENAALVPITDVSFQGAKFGGGPVTVRAYALGVQAIQKSSFHKGPPDRAEVAEILVPNEWLKRPGFKIPKENISRRPQYFFEIHAPENSLPGDYPARLHFSRNGRAFDISLQLRVHKLKLPKHFKLKTSFGFAPYEALLKHFGKWTDEEFEIDEEYVRSAAENRIDLHKIYIMIPEAGGQKGAERDPLQEGDKMAFLRVWETMNSPGLTRFGYSASFTDLPVPDEEKNHPTEGFWKALESSVIRHNLLDKTFVYFVDEPANKEYPKLRENLKKIRQWAPQLLFLGTLTYQKELNGSFNLWCPNLVQWDQAGFAKPHEYIDRRENHNEHFWIYTSCSAHGCGPAEDAKIPDLVTDRSAAYHRAFPWAAFAARAEGILYFNTVEGYGASSGDFSPWRDPFLFHGNGEGNLFYPCTPRFCGTVGISVVESLRLKSIRDGLEDVEILEAGEKAGLPVRDWMKPAYRGVRDFSKSNAEFEKVKVRVLEALDRPPAKLKK